MVTQLCMSQLACSRPLAFHDRRGQHQRKACHWRVTSSEGRQLLLNTDSAQDSKVMANRSHNPMAKVQHEYDSTIAQAYLTKQCEVVL